MQQTQCPFQHEGQYRGHDCFCLRVAVCQGLGHLYVPVGELCPQELVHLPCRLTVLMRFHQTGHCFDELVVEADHGP